MIAHRIASHLPMEITQKQELLETIRPDESRNQDEQMEPTSAIRTSKVKPR